MKTIIATLPAESVHDDKNYGGEKEMISAWNVVAFRDGEYYEPVTLRTYCGRPRDSSRVYASVWVMGFSGFGGCSGHGFADGYGYHKASAACAAALRSAGITLSAPIEGGGDRMIEEALGAIARALGFDHFTIVRN